MTTRLAVPQPVRPGLTVPRGACAGLLTGALLGGLVGTVVWPVVATFFSAFVGAAAGVAAGAASGLAVWLVARSTSSAGPCRAVVGSVWLAATAGVTLAASRRTTGWAVLGDIALVVAAGALGAFVGPMLAHGFAPVRLRHGEPVPVPRVVRRALAWGAAAGAVVGAVAGLVVGLATYPPTAGFALGEGAVLGSVSGIVLALLVATVLVLPRLRARG